MVKQKILVIDDDPSFLMMASKELSGGGYEVKTAEDGQKGVALACGEDFDLVYTDLVMPGLDGVQVCEQIKDLKPDLQVFLISAHQDKVLKQHLDFLKAGGRDKYLRKPLDPGELLEETNQVMQELRGA